MQMRRSARRAAGLLAVVALAALAACGGDDGPSWERVVDLEGASYSMVTAGGDLWVGLDTDDGEFVVRLDGDSGEELSRVEVGSFDGGLVAIGDSVFAGTYGYSRFGVIDGSVDLATGGELTVGDTPVLLGDRVFATAEVDGIRAVVELDPETLDLIGVVEIPTGPSDPVVNEVLWFGLTTVGDGLLVPVALAGSGRGFVLFEPGAPALTWWTTRASDEYVVSTAVVDDIVWVLGIRLALYGLDVATGDVLVSTRLPTTDDVGGLLYEDATSLAAGEDGTLWAVHQSVQTLLQLDPVSGETLATWQLDKLPQSIVLVDGLIWTNNTYRDSLTRIDRSLLPVPTEE